jgi:gamma-glutamyltranspeptidase/glutathione hydrolase
VRNSKLAATLKRIAAEGPRALYEGPIAADLLSAVRARGGGMTPEDLTGYAPVERKPIHVRWANRDVYTMPPPSAGGLLLAETLGLFEPAELKRLGHGTGAYTHLLAEGMRGALADRLQAIGDPAFTKVDVAALLSRERLQKRRSSFGLDRTHALPRFKMEEHGTHHIVTADGDGNVVSLTTTVNRPFGSQIVAKGSGIVLNDELDDFTPNAAVAPFGLTQSPNRARPGARPVSSMTPTLVIDDGAAVLALGGSGGMTIAPNVTEVILGRLVFDLDLKAAIEAKRFSIPTSGGTIEVEPGTPEAIVKDLEWRGEIVKTQRFAAYAVQAIAIDGGEKIPAADPRKHGTAAAR